jgi:ribosomal protein L14E/L6E/L27E
MDIVKGSVVKSRAGRDKDEFFVVLDVKDSLAYIANGRDRKVEKPKLKNLKHLAATNAILLLPATNKQLRKMLKEFGNQED